MENETLCIVKYSPDAFKNIEALSYEHLLSVDPTISRDDIRVYWRQVHFLWCVLQKFDNLSGLNDAPVEIGQLVVQNKIFGYEAGDNLFFGVPGVVVAMGTEKIISYLWELLENDTEQRTCDKLKVFHLDS